jgi:DNA-binding SARP family transcriptional activator
VDEPSWTALVPSGEALAGVQITRFLETAAAELEELRLAAIEARVAAELDEGCHQRLVGELEALVRANPLRETLWEHLVVALYRSGRQSVALRACAEVRRLLAGDIGVGPGPRLRELEAAVLAQDPGLDLPTAPVAPVDAGIQFAGLEARPGGRAARPVRPGERRDRPRLPGRRRRT